MILRNQDMKAAIDKPDQVEQNYLLSKYSSLSWSVHCHEVIIMFEYSYWNTFMPCINSPS